MTCVYCRVQNKFSVCIKTTSSCIQKKKLKLCFCIWTRMTWPRISESTFPSKISSHNSWKTAQLSKMIMKVSLWQSNDLNTMLCHQSFLVQCLLSTYWKLLPFSESIWLLFFSMIFKPWVFDKFIQFKRYINSACYYFHCFSPKTAGGRGGGGGRGQFEPPVVFQKIYLLKRMWNLGFLWLLILS